MCQWRRGRNQQSHQRLPIRRGWWGWPVADHDSAAWPHGVDSDVLFVIVFVSPQLRLIAQLQCVFLFVFCSQCNYCVFLIVYIGVCRCTFSNILELHSFSFVPTLFQNDVCSCDSCYLDFEEKLPAVPQRVTERKVVKFCFMSWNWVEQTYISTMLFCAISCFTALFWYRPWRRNPHPAATRLPRQVIGQHKLAQWWTKWAMLSQSFGLLTSRNSAMIFSIFQLMGLERFFCITFRHSRACSDAAFSGSSYLRSFVWSRRFFSRSGRPFTCWLLSEKWWCVMKTWRKLCVASVDVVFRMIDQFYAQSGQKKCLVVCLCVAMSAIHGCLVVAAGYFGRGNQRCRIADFC